MVAPFPDAPSSFVTSSDGTPIAVFSAGTGPDLVLVHGTTADHRTWRVVGPRLALRHTLHAIDRRGRGSSGDSVTYAIERELEDVAAVAGVLSGATGHPVDVVGHSLGGRIAMGASLRTDGVRRVVAYEGAPTRVPGREVSAGEAAGDAVPAGEAAAAGRQGDDLLARLRADLAAGDLETLLSRFMTEATGMTADDLRRFRADPVWPRRVAAAPTIIRELEAAGTAAAISLQALGQVRVPMLQLAGSESPAAFRDGASALDTRLADGRLMVIDGARHAAHHSHPDQFIAAVEAFLDG